MQYLQYWVGKYYIKELREVTASLYLDNNSDNWLATLKNNSIRALVAGPPQTVANGVLGLHWEEEAGGEVVNTVDTRRVSGLLLKIRQVLWLEVAVDPEDEVPEQGEHQPGGEEAREEDEEQVAPSQIHQRRPSILEKQQILLINSNIDNSQVSVLLHESPNFLFSVSEFTTVCNCSRGSKLF